MTFEEWFESYTAQGWQVSKAACLAAWNAAKEDSKPVAEVYRKEYYNLTQYHIKSSDGYDFGVWDTKEQAEQWAIEGGYRIAE